MLIPESFETIGRLKLSVNMEPELLLADGVGLIHLMEGDPFGDSPMEISVWGDSTVKLDVIC